MRRNIEALLLCVLLLAAGASASMQTPVMPEDLAAADEAWRTALRAADAKALGALIAEDFSWTVWDGTVLTKSEVLEKTGKGDFKGSGTAASSVRIYGTTAVVSGTAANQVRTIRWNRVWTKRDGTWKAVVHQGTLVQPVESK